MIAGSLLCYAIVEPTEEGCETGVAIEGYCIATKVLYKNS
jgi:hypothetical protein